MLRRLAVATVGLALVLSAIVAPAQQVVQPPTAAWLAHHVAVLAAPDMEGRGSATPGGDRAAQQIAAWLREAGLQPAGDAGSFFQSFQVSMVTKVAAGTELTLLASSMHENVRLDSDWRPHGGSLENEVEGPIMFVGHGVRTPDARHDDYADIDVHGKIAVALDGAPGDVPAAEATRLEKLIAARRHGAAALLIVSDKLPALAATAAPVKIVSGSITSAAADRLLAASGWTTARLQKKLRDSGTPFPVEVPARARIRVTLAREPATTANVIGMLPGRDPARAADAVVIGAHYDHLGRVKGTIHPGADDNASGTALVVGLARAFAAAGGASRTLVFALFSGEEIGLLGSRHYVRQPAVPMAQTVAMVNLDMVGRLRDDKLMVGGADTGVGLRQIVQDAARDVPIKLDMKPGLSGASDHAGFYRGGAPVLFFHTGTHDDYHKPGDTADKINAEGMARIGALAAAVIQRLADGPRATYAAIPAEPERQRRPSRRGGNAFFGIMARPSEADGLTLAEVVPGSAAARAGVQAGDVIVRFAGMPVNGFDDLVKALADKKAGDRVVVFYLHDGEERTSTTSLDARP